MVVCIKVWGHLRKSFYLCYGKVFRLRGSINPPGSLDCNSNFSAFVGFLCLLPIFTIYQVFCSSYLSCYQLATARFVYFCLYSSCRNAIGMHAVLQSLKTWCADQCFISRYNKTFKRALEKFVKSSHFPNNSSGSVPPIKLKLICDIIPTKAKIFAIKVWFILRPSAT